MESVLKQALPKEVIEVQEAIAPPSCAARNVSTATGTLKLLIKELLQ